MAVIPDVGILAKYIINIIMGIAVMTLIIVILPTGSLPSDVKLAIEWLSQLMVDFDFVLPVSTIFWVLFLTISIKTAILSVSGIKWIWVVLTTKRD